MRPPTWNFTGFHFYLYPPQSLFPPCPLLRDDPPRRTLRTSAGHRLVTLGSGQSTTLLQNDNLRARSCKTVSSQLPTVAIRELLHSVPPSPWCIYSTQYPQVPGVYTPLSTPSPWCIYSTQYPQVPGVYTPLSTPSPWCIYSTQYPLVPGVYTPLSTH